MKQMNLREWSILTESERKEWLHEQSPKSLMALLGMIGDILVETDSFDKQLETLDNPGNELLLARDFTRATLQEVEHYIVDTMKEIKPLLERTV